MDIKFVDLAEDGGQEKFATLVNNIKKEFLTFHDITVDESIEEMKKKPDMYPLLPGTSDIEESIAAMLFNVAVADEEEIKDVVLTETYQFIVILFRSAVLMDCTWKQLLTGVRSYIQFEKFSETSIEYFNKVFWLGN